MSTNHFGKNTTMNCKLTNFELLERKRTVLAELKKRIVKKRELTKGSEYYFPGSDEVIDQLTLFVKAERICCDFLTYHMKIPGKPKGLTKLLISGPEGTNEFLRQELNF